MGGPAHVASSRRLRVDRDAQQPGCALDNELQIGDVIILESSRVAEPIS